MGERPWFTSSYGSGSFVVLRAAGRPVEMRYTPAEWSAFVAGARLGEFAPRRVGAV